MFFYNYKISLLSDFDQMCFFVMLLVDAIVTAQLLIGGLLQFIQTIYCIILFQLSSETLDVFLRTCKIFCCFNYSNSKI